MGILDNFSSSYDAAKVPERGDVPDGKYVVSIHSAQLKTAKSSGAPMISWDLVIASGPQAKRHVFKNSVITERGITYIKADLAIAGFKGKLSDLETPDGFTEFLDRMLEITLKTKGDNQACYYNRLLKDDERTAHGSTPF